MTNWGTKLAEVSTAQLRQRLAKESDPKAIKRLVAALEYKAGLSPAEIEAKYGWPTQTVYGWLDRFEERGVDAALHDIPLPGRPPRLTPEHRQQYIATVNKPPSDAGYDEPTWSPALLQQYLVDAFDVSFSREHCRRLLHEAGLSFQTARPVHYKADPAAQRRWRSEFKKSGRH